MRKVVWKYWHVDPLDHFKAINNAETEIWTKIHQIVEQIKSNTQKNSDRYPKVYKILELGCANGRNLIVARKLFQSLYNNVRLIGIDINSRAISEGQDHIIAESLENIQLENADICKTDLKDIDIMVSVATLLYLSNKEIHVILQKLLCSDIKFFVMFEPLSEGDTFIGEYNNYHSLDTFDILKNEFTPYELKFKNSGWDNITGVTSKAIIWSSKKIKFELEL